MKNKLLGFTLLAAALFAETGRADIFDRINECERQGGGSCVYDIMRELARNKPGGGLLLHGGTYVSESWSMTVGVSGNTVTISGDGSIGEAGVYQCTGLTCTGATYSLVINGPDQITMSYGRVWNRRVN